MSLAATRAEIHYPESDGMPMAETDLHRDWMIWLIDALKYRYRGQRVYVSGGLFVYYVEGRPEFSVAPEAEALARQEETRARRAAEAEVARLKAMFENRDKT